MATASHTYFTYSTPHGPVTIGASARGVVQVAYEATRLDGANKASALTNQAANQLQEYLAGKRHTFDIALDMQGSPFQKEVWAQVCEIPYGETRTPTQIAEAIGKAGSHRSVGTAIRMNKLAPFVPTHRVSQPNATGQQARIFRAFQTLEKRAR